MPAPHRKRGIAVVTDVASPPADTPRVAALSGERPADAVAPLATAGLLLVAAAGVVWTAAVGAVAVWRHNQFLSHRFDLGNMVQAVWSTAEGRPLTVTHGETAEEIVRLGGHVDPILVLFAPFWWIHPHAETVIVVQAAALAAGIYPVVRLALKHTGSRVAAALLGAWYLAFPWLLWGAVNDMHPVTLAIPLLLYAIWFLDQHRLGAFAVVATLALLCGELIGLTVAGLGVWYAISHKRVRAGLGIALAGVTWTMVCLWLVVPAFSDGENRFYGFFDSVGGSPTGLLKTLVTDPGTVLAAVTTGADGRYVMWLLLPTAVLALGAPLVLIGAIPQLGLNLLADWWPSTQPEFQYVGPMVAPLVAATIVAIGRLPRRVRRFYALVPLAAALLCLAAKPPLPGQQLYVFGERESAARRAAMRAAIDRIPSEASVTASNRLGAHLSARRFIYLFPERSQSDWVVVDIRDSFVARGGERHDADLVQREAAALERDAKWRLVFEQADIRVYRRVS